MAERFGGNETIYRRNLFTKHKKEKRFDSRHDSRTDHAM